MTYQGGDSDVFVAKLNSSLTSLASSTYLGGSLADSAYAAYLDASGNIYVAGPTLSTNFPTTTNAYQGNLAGSTYDGFIAELNGGLTSLLASTYLGGASEEDFINEIALDTLGNVLLLAGPLPPISPPPPALTKGLLRDYTGIILYPNSIPV